jgi:tetratricopeptide (TPR) repeat protein
MPHFSLVVSATLLLAPALPAQIRGITTPETRGTPSDDTSRSHGLAGFEEADEPAFARHPATPHEPLRAARKAAEKAEHLAKKKQHEEAIAEYREAVALDPLYFEAWNDLALELETAGKADEAEQVYRRLTQSNPEHVLAFTNLADLLSSQKRYAEAETVARQAMKFHSYSFKANLVLGTVLVNEGKWSEEAKTKLEYAQVKYPQAKSLLDRWPTR